MNANIFEFQNREILMQFNPLFLPTNNIVEKSAISKASKLSNSSYLFSDIIKVFTGSNLINTDDAGLAASQENTSKQKIPAGNIFTINLDLKGDSTNIKGELKNNKSALLVLNSIVGLINKLSGDIEGNLQSIEIAEGNSNKKDDVANQKLLTSDGLKALFENILRLSGSNNEVKNDQGEEDSSKDKSKNDDDTKNLISQMLLSLKTNAPVIINIVSKTETLKIKLSRDEEQEQQQPGKDYFDNNSPEQLQNENEFNFKLINNTGFQKAPNKPNHLFSLEEPQKKSELNKSNLNSMPDKSGEILLDSNENEISTVNKGENTSTDAVNLDLTGDINKAALNENKSEEAIAEENIFSKKSQRSNDHLKFLKPNTGTEGKVFYKLKFDISNTQKLSGGLKPDQKADFVRDTIIKPVENKQVKNASDLFTDKLFVSKNSFKVINKISKQQNNNPIKLNVNKVSDTDNTNAETENKLGRVKSSGKTKILNVQIKVDESIVSENDTKNTDKEQIKNIATTGRNKIEISIQENKTLSKSEQNKPENKTNANSQIRDNSTEVKLPGDKKIKVQDPNKLILESISSEKIDKNKTENKTDIKNFEELKLTEENRISNKKPDSLVQETKISTKNDENKIEGNSDTKDNIKNNIDEVKFVDESTTQAQKLDNSNKENLQIDPDKIINDQKNSAQNYDNKNINGKIEYQSNNQLNLNKENIINQKPFDIDFQNPVKENKFDYPKQDNASGHQLKNTVENNKPITNQITGKSISDEKINTDSSKQILVSTKGNQTVDFKQSNSNINSNENIKAGNPVETSIGEKPFKENLDNSLTNSRQDDSGNSKDQNQSYQNKGENLFSSYLNKIDNNSVYSIRKPVNTGDFGDQIKRVDSSEIVKEISKLASNQNQKNIVMKLIPENLGKIKISMDISNNNIIHVHAEVENEAAKALMQNNVDNLKQSLVQQGMQLNSINISLSNQHEQKSNKSYLSRRRPVYSDKIKEINESEHRTVSKNYGYNTYEFLA